jgi:cyclopropane fatty-acyl-phospholipid synthase-like methyltransferase
MEKPFSQSCENNKEPILNVLREAFRKASFVLEIGSGTGQHTVHFARNLPHLIWQPTDLAENIPGMKIWFDEANLPNINEPIVLNVSDAMWPVGEADAIFSANTFHIMAKSKIECMFDGMVPVINDGGTLCIYGPFNYGGRYTSESNEKFDAWLRELDPQSAIRDFEWVNSLAERIGLKLVKDHEMPANNRLLEWRKSTRP